MRVARSALLSLVASAAFAVPPAVTLLPHLPGDSAIAPAVNSQAQQSIARGGDVHLVAWTDYRGRDGGNQTIQSDADIFGMRLDSNGNPLDMCPFVIAGGLGMQQRAKAAWDGEVCLAAWSAGPSGVTPTVVWDGLRFVVAWDDQRKQATFYDARTDVFARRVSEQGVVLDSSAFSIGAAPEGDAAIALHAVGDGATLSVWSRFDTSAMFDSYRVQTAAIGELLLLGDTNCDGFISVGDISGFVMALTDPSGYAAHFPACDMMAADTNEDGVISVGDIAGFVAMLMPR